MGGPHATFVARFVAPFPVFPGDDTRFYVLYVAGPCRTDIGVSSYDRTYLLPGDPATLAVGHSDIERDWCPGRYRGRITYERDPLRGPTVVRTLYSGITFTVQSRARLRQRASRPDAVKLFPRVGGPRETFVLRFTAPYPTSVRGPRFESLYEFSGRGPRGCRRVLGYDYGGELVRGDRAVVELTNESIGAGRRRQWCPGHYRGHVDYFRWTSDEEQDVVLHRRVISNIRFTVRRDPPG